jgi:hypothetical protein
LLFYIREISGSKLVSKTGCPHWGVQSLQFNARIVATLWYSWPPNSYFSQSVTLIQDTKDISLNIYFWNIESQYYLLWTVSKPITASAVQCNRLWVV